MIPTSFYPVILTEKVALSSTFYSTYFGFEKVYEADWYVSLKLATGKVSYELALLDASHPTIPLIYQKRVQGLILNFEVADVDSEYMRLIQNEKLPLQLDIRNEEFGQRHFITSDPNGVLLDIIQIIPPSETESAKYADKIWLSNSNGEME
ncbi:glyoxalase/bleomycin resistance/extradiol dioxygenase family protein [Paenibacillus brevis]|uniref:Glyoxalase/bleomycin resistance/extradiol dioxygenase family protein n=1 Tax=Paenibacillus brevis TaxID=2841508 RepID=A0ABS6FK51_9BACL|nr:glyoxalase/bleomycin resistance/extradiol dioxygenase family protein [Paenibacillus brevis]MBU5670536.1 glyoxalase/bleomycin resistance/extradiol dioxygenase family protein [Paenibacillus brevis]